MANLVIKLKLHHPLEIKLKTTKNKYDVVGWSIKQ